MKKELLKQLIIDLNEKRHFDLGIQRENLKKVNQYFRTNHIVVITGPRRAGKSTLLNQFMKEIEDKDYYYFAFDDERLIDFKTEDFSLLFELFVELYGEKHLFIFDEIQNVKNWERFVNRTQKEGYKFILTGSNAFLLSREFSTFLTGRHLDILLFPFSFKEFLNFKSFVFKKNLTTIEKAKLKKEFFEYFNKGGFPEYLKSNEKEVLRALYDDIILKDVISRYNIKEKESLREIAFYLISNISRPFTFNKLKNIFGIKSTNTVTDFVKYLEETYLFFSLKRFGKSMKIQNKSPRKFYCVDNGLINSVAFRTSIDKGRLLENLVFVELKRRMKEIFYFKGKNECDFLIKNDLKITDAIQVCYVLNGSNKKREVAGLLEAMNDFGLKEGLILTFDDEDDFVVDGKKVIVRPVWKWLMESIC